MPGQAELAGQLGRDRLDAGAVRVLGHQQLPARPDQAGDGELGPVRLDPALVQLEDLPVAAAVAEVVVRDLPQRLVEPADRRIDRVHLVGVGRVVRLRTFGRASAWLTATLISTSTHHTSWIQASQTITDRMRRIALMSSWLVSADS